MQGAAGMQGQGDPQEGQQSGEQQDAAGGGAGDEVGGAGVDNFGGSPGQQNGASQDNNPDGEGEGEYPMVFAPQRIGGKPGEDEMVLEPDSSGVPVVQGEFAQNPSGDVSVPYNQVFSDYSNAANRALESDYIPLGMRDVVRDYFTSLDPSQGQASPPQGDAADKHTANK